MRDNIRLVSSAGTGFMYYTTKNKRTTPEKIVLKKFCRTCRKQADHKETK